jgi:hypothetical protein
MLEAVTLHSRADTFRVSRKLTAQGRDTGSSPVRAAISIGRGLVALSRMESKNSAQVVVVASAGPNLHRNCEA